MVASAGRPHCFCLSSPLNWQFADVLSSLYAEMILHDGPYAVQCALND